MPKCPKCGKRFQTSSALDDHYAAVHPNERFVAPKTSSSRTLMVSLVIVILVVGSIVGVLIYLQSNSGKTQDNSELNSILNAPINSSLFAQLTGVSSSTLASIGSGSAIVGNSVGALQSVSGQPLVSGGKPEILYVGADYCPHCASERWAIVVALSRFGNFSNLSYMLSAPTDGNLSTLTFHGSSYFSNYISFVSVETTERNPNVRLETMTQDQQSLFSQYNSQGYIPFIDIYNKYVTVGSQFPNDESLLSGLSWSRIGSQLNNPSSNIAKAIDGSANILISAICKVDGQQPSNVCGQSFAKLSAVLSVSPSTIPQSSLTCPIVTPLVYFQTSFAYFRRTAILRVAEY